MPNIIPAMLKAIADRSADLILKISPFLSASPDWKGKMVVVEEEEERRWRRVWERGRDKNTFVNIHFPFEYSKYMYLLFYGSE